jgi:hypothetical protein
MIFNCSSHKSKTEFAFYCDINIDNFYWKFSHTMFKLTLTSFNLTPIVSFPTGVIKYCSTAVDNISIDSSRRGCISIKLVINELSDHDVQHLVIKSIDSVLNDHIGKK